jgi:NitT/TauT family transport system ATP-binding protein
MDEPFAAVDSQTRIQLQQELLAIWEQEHRSVIFVTHDIDEAVLLSDRVLVMSSQPGTIREQFGVSFDRPRSPALALEEEFVQLKRRIWVCLGQGSSSAGPSSLVAVV